MKRRPNCVHHHNERSPFKPALPMTRAFFSLPFGRVQLLARILISGSVVFLVLVAVKNGWVLRESGLTGSCSVYATESTGVQQEKCTSGRLDGRPSLADKGCLLQSTTGKTQFWLCPAPIASSRAGV
jgi:hypothetical protein